MQPDIDKILERGAQRRREALRQGERRRSLKAILRGEGERHNLQSGLLCVLVVLVLTAVVFGLVNLKFAFKDAPESASETAVPVEAGQ